MAALLIPLACLGGCGGLPPSGPTQATAAVAVIDAQDATTNAAITVDATAICGGVRGTITTDQGSVVLRDIPFGTGTPPNQPLTVTAPGYVTFAEPIQISTTVVTFYTAILQPASLDTTGTVKGQITDSSTGDPITSALVKFSHTDATGTTEVQGYTDNSGNYIIGGIPIGINNVSAAADGYATAVDSMNVVQDSNGGQNSDKNLSLLPGSTKVDVTGVVVDAFNQNPLTGAQVTLGSQPAVTTDANGKFSIPSVPIGSQALKVTLSGYDDYTDQVNVLPTMGALRIAMTTTAPQPPSGPYNLQGTVTLNGRPDNSGATVTAVDVNSGQQLGQVVTPASGEYTMFLPPSTYRITATYGTQSVHRTQIVLGGGRITTGVDFIMTIQ